VTPAFETSLHNILERSRALGFLGPGSVRVHVSHAQGFAHEIEPPGRFLDLGSGGGVPGLVLAGTWSGAEAVLLDASARRCEFLVEAVGQLGWADRVTVVRARAEEAARRDDLRAGLDLVVARGFGPPSVTAECGAPFLRLGGRLVVSEPPVDDREVPVGSEPAAGDGGDGAAVGTAVGGDGPGVGTTVGKASRWPVAGLAELGLRPDRAWSEPYHYRSLVLERPCPDRYPRRVGIPAKRPLF
jgi:16S rRNA (guanine527-N7)-methyltransferase